MTFGIVTVVALVILSWMICGLKDSAKAKGIQKKYKKSQTSRTALTDLEFCRRANLSEAEANYVFRFRSAFADIGKFDPQKMYPEDNYGDYGISYDDDMAMFLHNKDLLLDHPRYRYSFPLEEVSDFGSLIRVTLKINQEIKQFDSPHSAISGVGDRER